MRTRRYKVGALSARYVYKLNLISKRNVGWYLFYICAFEIPLLNYFVMNNNNKIVRLLLDNACDMLHEEQIRLLPWSTPCRAVMCRTNCRKHVSCV